MHCSLRAAHAVLTTARLSCCHAHTALAEDISMLRIFGWPLQLILPGIKPAWCSEDDFEQLRLENPGYRERLTAKQLHRPAGEQDGGAAAPGETAKMARCHACLAVHCSGGDACLPAPPLHLGM